MPARSAPLPWLKPALFVGGLVPLAQLLFQAARHTLGADAIALGLNRLGLLALIFLVASLACTPLKALAGWTWPMRVRRMLGLFAFFYASLHVLAYVVLDQGLDWEVLLADITQRKFIIVGLLAFLALVPLALTSTNGMVRRLGYPRWRALHRLAYAAGVLGVVHFFFRVKRDAREPEAYAVVLALLLGVRLWAALRPRLSLGRAAPP